MNLPQETDFTTLGWIKPELDSTLAQARQALERYAADSSDTQAMRDCVSDLHTTHGTLHMVELYGAALVVEEMERVARGLLDGSIAAREDVYSVLMRGFLQLPDYLERLQSGHKDIPIVLLPLLNDLRAARGDKLLSEAVLFAPNIDAALPIPAEQPLHPEILRTTARNLRNDYQHSLLRWIREPASTAPLARIAQIFGILYSGCASDEGRRLWWVAGATVEGLQTDAIEASVAMKLLFGKLDREIKRLSDDGERALAATQTKDQVRNLLYYIAHAKPRGSHIEAVIKFYGLDNLLPTQEELEHAHGSISGHNRALLDTVAGSIREDLLRVKETLNVYLHSPNRNLSDLAQQAETLGGLADTFGMLGMGMPRQRVIEQRHAIERIVSGDAEANEDNLLDIAGDLLVVEASLEDHISRLGIADESASEPTTNIVPRVEVVRLLYVLMQEALVNIAKVKQGIVAFIDGAWDHSQIDPAPALLAEVAGALDMLALRDAVKPVNLIGLYIQNELLEYRHVPERDQIDALANAVASIEYYIEAVREQRGDRDRVLELACENLARLDYWPEIKTPAERAAARSAESAAPAQAVASTPADSTPMIDEELRQVFLDEMDDEIANLRKHFPLWRADPEETENLKVVRRSFHTLKGSGRLVGAVALGDFAWKIENMLNRVLDRSIAASAPLLQVVAYAIGALPRFRSELSRHERSSVSMDGFFEAVERLCAGDTSPVDETRFAGPATSEAAASEEPVGESAVNEMQAPGTHEAVEHSSEAVAAETTVPVPSTSGVAIEPPPVFEVKPILESEIPIEIESMEPAVLLADSEPEPVVEVEPQIAAAHFADAEQHVESVAPVVSAAGDSGEEAQHAWRQAPHIDRLLLDVLHSEAETHLAVLDSAVALGHEQSLAVRENLVRAVHTLNGAFAMAEVAPMVHLLAPLEGWLARSHNANRLLDSDAVGVLDAVSVQVKQALSALEGKGELPDTSALVARISALRDGVQANEAIVVESEHADESPHTPHTPDTSEEVAQASLDAVLPQTTHIAESAGIVDTAQTSSSSDAESALTAYEVLLAQAATAAAGVTNSPVSAETLESAQESTSAAEGAGDAVGGHSSAVEPVAATSGEAPITPTAPISDELAARDEFALEPHVDEAMTHVPESPEPVVVYSQSAGFESMTHESIPQESPGAQAVSADEVHPMPEIDQDLLDVFVLEAQEILDRSDALMLRLRAEPGDGSLIDELRRDLHTIKGGANMSSLPTIGDLGHALESLLEGVVERGQMLDTAMMQAVEQGLDTLHSLVQATAAQQPTTMPTALIGHIETLSHAESEAVSPGDSPATENVAAIDAVSGSESATSERSREGDGAEGSAEEKLTEAAQPVATALQQTGGAFVGAEYIRVRATQLDAMVNGASEVAIYRSRLEQQIASYRANVVEMETTVSRLREQLRRLELEAEAQMASRFQRAGDASSFDPLELDRFSQLQQLSRSLAESMSDMVAIQVGFDQLTRQSESLLMQQSRVSGDLQDSLMRTRMVPFDSLVPALRRTLRQTASSLGKEAVLRVEGAHGEMDRTLLERMKAPIEHMLRNAVAHGLESLPERLAAGKPIEGNVRVSLAREANEIVLRISDDGRGLDRAAIRRRAIERGLLLPDARVTDQELDAFILTSGFSTAESLTQVAGRGIGMDVVANQIKQVGGSLSIESNPGRGAAFTARLPFTLGVTQAIIVRLGDANYAIPMSAVQGAVHVTRSELDSRMAAEEPEYVYSGVSYPIIDLAPQLGEISPVVADDVPLPLLIVRSGDQRAAVRVDAVHGSREIVVKSVGPQVTSVPGILGATIMGDGSVIMILDLVPLLRRVAGLRAQGAPVAVAPAAIRAHRRRLIMVVDDSITMRKATTRVLEREEMDVVTAKDGIDAIEKLADRLPDLVVLDIEMPRMDGYQFAEHMKGDPRTRQIPIVMVTSRTGEKHRARAKEIGVEGYLGKPYQDVELIKNIRDLLAAAQ